MGKDGKTTPPRADQQAQGEHQAEAGGHHHNGKDRQRRHIKKEGSYGPDKEDRQENAEDNRKVDLHS